MPSVNNKQAAQYAARFNTPGHTLVVQIATFSFEEDGRTFVYNPALNLMAYGKDLEKARSEFSQLMGIYMEYTLNKGTLEADLIALGWKKKRNKHLAPPSIQELKARNTEFGAMMKKKNFAKPAPYPMQLPS